MTLNDGFTRTVAEWLDEQAGRGAPGYLDEVLTRTTRTRQRPAWSSLERWLPVQTTLRLAPVPRVAWLLVVLALLVAFGAAILVVGSRPRPAPLLGLARNGPVAYAQDGDIYTVDPSTGATTALITGPTDDTAPYYSRDGQSMVFLRSSGGGEVSVAVADANGSDVRVLTGPMFEQTWFDWSADGSRLALISTIDGIPSITVANVDGSGTQVLDVGMPADFVAWRGPDGGELLFRGYPTGSAGQQAGLFTVKPDGTGLLQVSPTLDGLGAYQSPSVSPDGTRVSYTTFELDSTFRSGPKWDGMLLRLHVLDLRTGADTVIPVAPDPIDPTLPTDQGYAVFSADGLQLAFQRTTSDSRLEIVLAPADGSAIGKPIGPSMPFVFNSDGPSFEFSPDASAIIATYPSEGIVRILPIDGSTASTLPWDKDALPSMQRLPR